MYDLALRTYTAAALAAMGPSQEFVGALPGSMDGPSMNLEGHAMRVHHHEHVAEGGTPSMGAAWSTSATEAAQPQKVPPLGRVPNRNKKVHNGDLEKSLRRDLTPDFDAARLNPTHPQKLLT